MAITLETKVENLSGVGPRSSTKLLKLGIETVADLIFYYPRAYKDFTSTTSISKINSQSYGETITIRGKITGIHNKKTSRRRFTVTEAMVDDGTGNIKVVWFNQPFLTRMLTVGREVILNGKIDYNFYSREVVLESPERALRPMIVPVYGATAGISSNYISKLVLSVKKTISEIIEWLPEKILEENDLSNIDEALSNIHFPQNPSLLQESRKRIAFDELLLIALRANLSKYEIRKENAPVISPCESTLEFIKNLPYELTGDQKKAVLEIQNDINKSVPMNRLLNGDVGSGKTIVAAISARAAVENGYSVVLMAPTEILANQHFATFKKLFPENILGIVTASKKTSTEETKIFIGTHALIQKDVKIKNLGLVIVDEQHKFGVKQRGALSAMNSGQTFKPHFLSMTATPIPRTLHLALFGDLDLSLIREKPSNRKEIKTRFVEPQNRDRAYEFIRAHLKAGRQAYIICPLIEEKNAEDLGLFEDERKTVKREYEKLQKIFPEYKIGILHGRMKGSEKNETMQEFASGKINLLVSTSVVEVGVDVPNATIMIIEDAERFGLAQLHQFRGRVGRAEHQSFCFLFSSTMFDKAIQRLKALESTADGFKLAEIDLEARGPGAVFGTEQSGVLDLKMADFSDTILIEKASFVAKQIVQSDPELKSHPLLKNKITDYINHKHLE